MPYCSSLSEWLKRKELGAYHQRLRSWGAPRHINIHRHNTIASPRNTVTIMVITTSIRTASHRNDPSRIRHLIVDLSKRRSHLIRKCASNDHDIRLTRRGTEDYTKTILVVAGGGKVHHFDSAAGESEGHGPERTLTRPVGYLIQGRSEMDFSYF